MSFDPSMIHITEIWLRQITLTGRERPSNATSLVGLADGLCVFKHLELNEKSVVCSKSMGKNCAAERPCYLSKCPDLCLKH